MKLQETSRRLSITANGLIPGMRRGQALITLATGLSAPRICGGQSRQQQNRWRKACQINRRSSDLSARQYRTNKQVRLGSTTVMSMNATVVLPPSANNFNLGG